MTRHTAQDYQAGIDATHKIMVYMAQEFKHLRYLVDCSDVHRSLDDLWKQLQHLRAKAQADAEKEKDRG